MRKHNAHYIMPSFIRNGYFYADVIAANRGTRGTNLPSGRRKLKIAEGRVALRCSTMHFRLM